MTPAAAPNDPLLAGFFSTAAAARLVGAHPNTVRGWVEGYRKTKIGPVIDRDFEGTGALSFLDLMELRFISFFRSQGVGMPTIRLAAENLRRDLGVQHPLAVSSEKYVTDRKRIFGRSAQQEGDDLTFDMVSGQHEMWDMIEQTVEKGVVFDPSTHLASLWHPRADAFPEVIIDPRVAFGKPTVRGTRIPTSVLFQQFKADGSKQQVADWFEVDEEIVSTAIAFEIEAA